MLDKGIVCLCLRKRSAVEPLYRGHRWDLAGTQLAVLYTVEPLYRGHSWDLAGTQLAVLYTVEPLYRGHSWDPAGCPV